MLEKHNPEKASVDVLLFADSLDSVWYFEHSIPSSVAYSKGIGNGFDQMSDEEYNEYLASVEEKSPSNDRAFFYLDQADYYSAHHTTRAIASYKLAHELRKHGYTVQVISHFWYFTEEDFKKVIDKFITFMKSL